MGFSLFSQMPSYFLLALIQIVSHSCHAQQDYLDAHNKSRANVGVRPLTWDDRWQRTPNNMLPNWQMIATWFILMANLVHCHDGHESCGDVGR